MELLVSVSNAGEAQAAVEGGADIIDAKDPFEGALGAVHADTLTRIREAVDASRLVTAALGDAHAGVEELAREFVVRGARLVKVGFCGVRDAARVKAIVARLARACASVDQASGVIAVAYADDPVESPDAVRLVSIAARAGARGVLVDTADKRGPGLCELWSPAAIESWVAEVHAHELVAAVAGKLRLNDLAVVADVGADVAGVRGAACEGGRGGRVTAERVRALAATAALQRSTT
jgi:uncharacterized protein (UPF0264 family)